MNLLTDDLFQAVTDEGPGRLSLPGLLEALGADRVLALSGVQRHQADIFHIFLCYLAGAVLARQGQGDPKQSAAFWRNGLRSLAGREDDCAWELVVDDPAKPAFLQPPAPSRAVFQKGFPKTRSNQVGVVSEPVESDWVDLEWQRSGHPATREILLKIRDKKFDFVSGSAQPLGNLFNIHPTAACGRPMKTEINKSNARHLNS